jgi:uncharacterized protein YuzE
MKTAEHPHGGAWAVQGELHADEAMKIQYDQQRDLLYLSFIDENAKAARTETLGAGVHADFDRDDRLLGIEILEAASALGGRVQFDVALTAGS